MYAMCREGALIELLLNVFHPGQAPTAGGGDEDGGLLQVVVARPAALVQELESLNQVAQAQANLQRPQRGPRRPAQGGDLLREDVVVAG